MWQKPTGTLCGPITFLVNRHSFPEQHVKKLSATQNQRLDSYLIAYDGMHRSLSRFLLSINPLTALTRLQTQTLKNGCYFIQKSRSSRFVNNGQTFLNRAKPESRDEVLK